MMMQKFKKCPIKKSLSNLIKKLFIILCLSSINIDPFINNDFQFQEGLIKKPIFQEIVSFENKLIIYL